jgi:hypothetical protein
MTSWTRIIVVQRPYDGLDTQLDSRCRPPSPAPSVDWQQRYFETLGERNRFETALAQITECAASLEQAKTIAAAVRSPQVTCQVGEEDVRIDEWTC